MELIVLSNMKKPTAAAPVRGAKKDVIAQRIITFSVVLVIAVVTVMALKNSSISAALTFYNYVRPVLIAVFALLTAGAVVLWIVRCKKGVDESKSVFSAPLLTILSGGLLAACIGYSFLSGTRLLICLIAVSALFYIYYLYSRVFFTYAAVTLAGGLLLAFFRFGAGILGMIVPAVLLAALEVVVLMMLAGGKHPLGQIVPAEQKARLPFVITAAILLVGLVLGFVAPALLFYAVAILFASFLVIAIINTLQMM